MRFFLFITTLLLISCIGPANKENTATKVEMEINSTFLNHPCNLTESEDSALGEAVANKNIQKGAFKIMVIGDVFYRDTLLRKSYERLAKEKYNITFEYCGCNFSAAIKSYNETISNQLIEKYGMTLFETIDSLSYMYHKP